MMESKVSQKASVTQFPSWSNNLIIIHGSRVYVYILYRVSRRILSFAGAVGLRGSRLLMPSSPCNDGVFWSKTFLLHLPPFLVYFSAYNNVFNIISVFSTSRDPLYVVPGRTYKARLRLAWCITCTDDNSGPVWEKRGVH